MQYRNHCGPHYNALKGKLHYNYAHNIHHRQGTLVNFSLNWQHGVRGVCNVNVWGQGALQNSTLHKVPT